MLNDKNKGVDIMIENFGLIMFCAMIPIVIGVIVSVLNDKKKNSNSDFAEGSAMKKLNTLLNTIIGAFIGVFIGNGVYVVWNFKTCPELYAMQSAPWYTSILVSGAVTLAVVVVAVIAKIIIKKYAAKH